MCGICGFIDFNQDGSLEILNKMVLLMKHRGPDDSGCELYHCKDALIGFGQARLSILDLSCAGHQPMNFMHYSIVLNGEIYNFREIKSDLIKAGHRFMSESDTEVVLHSFHEWGTDCVTRFIGMFAFVILDRKEDKVYLFRDRAGVKPLYYYLNGEILIFSSELKSICQHPAFIKEIDQNAIGYYFKYGYIPSPHSIYSFTKKLMPGHYLQFELKSRCLKIIKYWDVNEYYSKPRLNISYPEAKEELKRILESACNYRMVSDVPVGVFLSGGFDSTGVTAILQKDRSDKIKTFTIGFEDGMNEAPYARRIAKYLGTDHTEYICKTDEAKSIIPELPFYYDEPFSDSSAIPTILVSRIAKKKVSVALSADGGDEVFCGYASYTALDNISRKINNLNHFEKFIIPSIAVLRKFMNDESVLNGKLERLHSLLKSEKKLRASFLSEGVHSLYVNYFNMILKNIKYPDNLYIFDSSGFDSQLSVSQSVDYKCYLENDILTKVDRATMSVSLEGREPLLDHRILEYVARLPIEYKYDKFTTKKIYKDIVYEYVPKEYLERPKSGFSLPINDWLRSDLKFLIDEYLSVKSLKKLEIYNVQGINRLIHSFMNRKLNDDSIIWRLVQFQMWASKWL